MTFLAQAAMKVFLENKDRQEDVSRLTGMMSFVDPYLGYLLIWLPVTEKLNPLLFPQLALILLVEGGSKPLQLALSCARAEARCRRDGGWFAFLCCGRFRQGRQILPCIGSSWISALQSAMPS